MPNTQYAFFTSKRNRGSQKENQPDPNHMNSIITQGKVFSVQSQSYCNNKRCRSGKKKMKRTKKKFP